MKKKITQPEVILLRMQYVHTVTISPGEDTSEGEGKVATRETTDFFGNTVLVPMDDDWE